MEQKKLDRINALSALSRMRELDEAEKLERAELRREYVASFRASLVGQLDNIVVEEPDGKRHKLKKKTP